MRTIMAGLAEFERDLIRSASSRAWHRRSRGVKLGPQAGPRPSDKKVLVHKEGLSYRPPLDAAPPPFCEKRLQCLSWQSKKACPCAQTLPSATEMNRPEHGSTSVATVTVHAPPKTCRVKHSTQMFGCIYVGRAQTGGLMTMRKIIGPALIVLTLAGCAMGGGDLPGDSTWSRDYLKVSGKQAPG